MPDHPLAMLAVALGLTALALPGASRGARGDEVPDSYLLRTARALELCRADMPRIISAAEAAAARLARGGGLLVAGEPGLISELTGRAGGLMLTRPVGDSVPGADDVVLCFPSSRHPIPPLVLGSPALLVTFADRKSGADARFVPTHAREAGISPTVAGAIAGWLFTGELVAALTRLGKMPVLYESIGLYGGVPRQNRYAGQGIFWHDSHQVPPLAPGILAGRYVDLVSAMLRRVEREERKRLDRAAAWARQARTAGKQLIMYSMGHIFPSEVQDTAIGRVFASGVWNSGFSYHQPPDDKYQPGDLLIHIGYQHPPEGMLQRGRAAGARVVYVDVMQHRDYVRDRGVIWIDPMWPWSDACVPVEGYDIPALAASGVVNGAIAWEIWRKTQAPSTR